jgi:hypothetical protein
MDHKLEKISEETVTRQLCINELQYPVDNNGKRSQTQQEEWLMTLLAKRIKLFCKFKALYDERLTSNLLPANHYFHLKDSFDRNFIAIVSNVQKLYPNKMSLYFSKDFDPDCIKFDNLLHTAKALKNMLMEVSDKENMSSCIEDIGNCIETIQNLIDDDKYKTFGIGKYGFIISNIVR